ncbi:MAG: PAC2 family protein [Actinomycetota bacterium]
MAIYELQREVTLTAPALIAALDGWVDAGAAGTTAASYIADGGEVLATFDSDALIDYRARRPTLDIRLGVLTEIGWPDLSIRRVHSSGRDLLVLTGPEPDYRWREFGASIVEIARRLGVVESVCMGAIPAMVAHTRPTPILVTGHHRRPREGDPPLPSEHMRVPAAAVSLVEVKLAEHGILSGGIWAQVPHYVAGTYYAGALALIERVAQHLGVRISVDALVEQVREERVRLDDVVASRPEARTYLEQLESSAQPLSISPSEDIGEEVERFLRETTGDNRNPFENPPDDGA